jgi:hypothetical protein
MGLWMQVCIGLLMHVVMRVCMGSLMQLLCALLHGATDAWHLPQPTSQKHITTEGHVAMLHVNPHQGLDALDCETNMFLCLWGWQEDVLGNSIFLRCRPRPRTRRWMRIYIILHSIPLSIFLRVIFSSYQKVVAMHTYSSDWRLVIIIFVIVCVLTC